MTAHRCALLLLVVFATSPRPLTARPTTCTKGMVVTAHALASEAGAEILRAGGNAADATAAAAFVLAVVEPYSSGIGGGGFALARFGGRVTFLDFREVAPTAAGRDMFRRDGQADPGLSRVGALAAAVPGAVAGYLDLHERFGKLPRAAILAPAIRFAERGFPVDERYREYARSRLEALGRDAEATRIFLLPGRAGGAPDVPPLGHRLVQKELAATLRTIAARGAAEFYRGSVATRLAADMVRRGGLVTLADLDAYRVRERPPLAGSFRGLTVLSAPPPSAGGQVVLTLLGLLAEIPAGARWRDADALHLYIEGSKRAFADRPLLGDPAFVPDVTRSLVDPARLGRLRRSIGERAEPALRIPPGQAAELDGAAAPHPPGQGGDNTTHLSVIDAAGNAVAMTTTINYAFGAAIVAQGTGVLWNDEMDDFAAAPGAPNVYGIVGGEANAVAPRKIPLSSMAPTLVLEGAGSEARVRMIVGAAGGPRIPTTVTQILMNHLVYGADIEQAVTAGRIHHQHLPDVVSVEPLALDALTRRELERRGHTIVEDEPASNANAIAVLPEQGGLRTGAADRRGYGLAVAE